LKKKILNEIHYSLRLCNLFSDINLNNKFKKYK